MSIENIYKNAPAHIRAMFAQKHRSVWLSTRSSYGCPICHTQQTSVLIDHHIQQLLQAGIIHPCKRSAFISYPFVRPKVNGTSRLLIDYSHLWNKYVKPKLYLPAFIQHLCRKHINLQDGMAARLDLSNTFYSVPLLPRLTNITNFRHRNKTYTFKALLMGLYISPAILQGIVNTAIETADCFKWAHVDDIILVANDCKTLHNNLTHVICSLHNWGFNINIHKSILSPPTCINFCGLWLDLLSGIYEMVPLFLQCLWETLKGEQISHQGARIVTYTLYMIGLSSVWRFIYAKHKGHLIWHFLQNGGWPLPQLPESFFAMDATEHKIVAVDQRQHNIFSLFIPPTKIYKSELLAIFCMALLAPTHRAIFCNNMAVIGATRHSHCPSWILLQLSILKACKDLQFIYIPSNCNPADKPTRNLSFTTHPLLGRVIKAQMCEW